MPTLNEKEREAFEIWAKERGWDLTPSNGRDYYRDDYVDGMVVGWQAASEGKAELLGALREVCRRFPADSDLAEAQWTPEEINAACDAYDKARALIAKHGA